MPEDNEAVVPEVQEEEEVASEATEETSEEQEEVDWKSEAEKAKELANNYKIRAEKAEKKAKEAPSQDAAQVSTADTIILSAAIAKGQVDPDDIERVQKFARSEGLSIKDALKNDELKAILAVRAEQRSTANAANVSNVRRGPSKVSDEVLVSNASAGKLPDDDDGIARLIAAKAKLKD